MSEILDGHVEILFAGGKATLSPTLYAATRISKAFGGFQPALNRVTAGDFEAISTVIRFGLGVPDGDANGFDEKVYQAGVLRLTAPATEYLLMLANGGRPLDDLGRDDDAEKKAEV